MEEQYRIHLEDIRGSAAQYDSYHLVFLKHQTFDNVQIFITDTRVSVIRMYPSLITFETSHPQICRAFQEYADRFQRSSLAGETL